MIAVAAARSRRAGGVLVRSAHDGRWCWQPDAIRSWEARAETGRVVGRLCGIVQVRHWHSTGTLVQAAYRRQGVALALWRQMIADVQPVKCFVDCITAEGVALVERLRAEHPGIGWSISTDWVE